MSEITRICAIKEREEKVLFEQLPIHIHLFSLTGLSPTLI